MSTSYLFVMLFSLVFMYALGVGPACLLKVNVAPEPKSLSTAALKEVSRCRLGAVVASGRGSFRQDTSQPGILEFSWL